MQLFFYRGDDSTVSHRLETGATAPGSPSTPRSQLPANQRRPLAGTDPCPSLSLSRQSRPSARRSTSRCPWTTTWRCSATWPAPTAPTTRASGWRTERRSPRRAAKEKTPTTSVCSYLWLWREFRLFSRNWLFWLCPLEFRISVTNSDISGH